MGMGHCPECGRDAATNAVCGKCRVRKHRALHGRRRREIPTDPAVVVKIIDGEMSARRRPDVVRTPTRTTAITREQYYAGELP